MVAAFRQAVKRRYYLLLALVAGIGLRTEEVLALRADHIKDSGRLVQVRSSICDVTQKEKEGTKSDAGIRDIDVPEPLAELLYQAVNERPTGYLFRTRDGKPYSYRNLAKMMRGKMVGVRGGFRQFRRYRIPFLTKSKVPSALIRYWTGHKGSRG